ncbi:MAG: hypothetical protein GY757_26580, partial [bacterium]|nr:hypothetical protein [bacterium]
MKTKPKTKIKDLNLFDMDEPEKEELRVQPGNEYREFKKEEIEQSVVLRFEKQVEEFEEKIAVKEENDELTYGELNRLSNKVGHSILENYDDRYRLSPEEKIRYKRQLKLKGWGIEAQETLKRTTVFVGGAGGSGSPTILQLALAGVGTIIVCDFDEVELSNLNRQFLHNESRIGMNKALSAKKTIEEINPHVNVIACTEPVTRDNVYEMVGDS